MTNVEYSWSMIAVLHCTVEWVPVRGQINISLVFYATIHLYPSAPLATFWAEVSIFTGNLTELPNVYYIYVQTNSKLAVEQL